MGKNGNGHEIEREPGVLSDKVKLAKVDALAKNLRSKAQLEAKLKKCKEAIDLCLRDLENGTDSTDAQEPLPLEGENDVDQGQAQA